MPIPRITHQIWLQGWDKRPDKFEENVKTLAKKNPDWIHMKWDEPKLLAEISKLGPAYVARYHAFEQIIQKVDFARYIILYNYGGVSIDLDMKSIKSLNEIPGINDSDFMISEGAVQILARLNNAIILCSPQNRHMKKIIDVILRDDRRCSDFFDNVALCTTMLTGPVRISAILEGDTDIIILPHDLFEPCYADTRDAVQCNITNRTILDHQHEGSWVPEWMKTLVQLVVLLYHYFPYIAAALFATVAWIYRKNILQLVSGKRR